MIALLTLANATFVHLVLAPDRASSSTLMILLIKSVVLDFLMVAAIRTPADQRAAVWSIVLCASDIG